MPSTAACLLLCAVSVSAAPPILSDNFESNDSGWMKFGGNDGSARVPITRDPAAVKSGKGALQFDYEASASAPTVAARATPGGIAGCKSLRMWMMAEKPTAAAVVLSEKDAGRYIAIVWLEPGVWQRVELVPEDFDLAKDATDPKDPDGKLDLDQVEAVSVLDLSQILGPKMAKSEAPIAIIAHTGAQKIDIDDFEVSGETPSWHKPRPAFLIEDFAHPQLSWLTFGGAELKPDASGKIVQGGAMDASYEQLEDHYVMMLRPLHAIDLAGATHLSFDIASDKNAHLLLAFQAAGSGAGEGPSYNADIEVVGGGKAAHWNVPFADFERDEHGAADPNGKLDLSRLKSFAILDITSAFTHQAGVNRIRIGNIQAVKLADPER